MWIRATGWGGGALGAHTIPILPYLSSGDHSGSGARSFPTVNVLQLRGRCWGVGQQGPGSSSKAGNCLRTTERPIPSHIGVSGPLFPFSIWYNGRAWPSLSPAMPGSGASMEQGSTLACLLACCSLCSYYTGAGLCSVHLRSSRQKTEKCQCAQTLHPHTCLFLALCLGLCASTSPASGLDPHVLLLRAPATANPEFMWLGAAALPTPWSSGLSQAAVWLPAAWADQVQSAKFSVSFYSPCSHIFTAVVPDLARL